VTLASERARSEQLLCATIFFHYQKKKVSRSAESRRVASYVPVGASSLNCTGYGRRATGYGPRTHPRRGTGLTSSPNASPEHFSGCAQGGREGGAWDWIGLIGEQGAGAGEACKGWVNSAGNIYKALHFHSFRYVRKSNGMLRIGCECVCCRDQDQDT
jgi:hypothetical protein